MLVSNGMVSRSRIGNLEESGDGRIQRILSRSRWATLAWIRRDDFAGENPLMKGARARR